MNPHAEQDISQYVYVDSAFGGANHRNKIKKFADIKLNGLADCYVSHNRATDALVTWVESHTNKNGNPTVEGFDGPTWADNLHLDLDHQSDPGVARGWLRQVLDKLEAAGVDLGAIRVFFSGSKGFHVEIPEVLFGGFTPSREFHRRLKRTAELILVDIPFDPSVYDALRLWRMPNSKHSKTGLYKIPLTVEEARTLTIEEIKGLAQAPRDIPIPGDEWEPVPALVDIWADTITDDESAERVEPHAPTDDARDRHTIAAIVASWPHDGENVTEGGDHVSRHTDYLMPVIGALVRHTPAEHVCELVATAAEQAGDRTFLDRDWREEIERIAEGASQRVLGGSGGVYGLRTLRLKFPALAAVLGALWVQDGPHVRIRRSTDGLLDEVPPFPLDVLPETFRTLCKEAAAALTCPPDFVAVTLVTAAGAMIGNGLAVVPKEGWTEGANLYTGIVGDPGSKKTPAVAIGVAPVEMIQRRLAAKHKQDKAEYEKQLGAWNELDKDERRHTPKPSPPPPYVHVMTTDTTVEALGPMLRDSKGILLSMDELSGWVRSMDQYRAGGKGADRQHYLSMWSRRTIKVDRKGNPEPILVPLPCLSVTGGIQTDLLSSLAGGARGNDGFVDRLLLSWPDPVPDRLTTDIVSPDAIDAVQEVFDRLYGLEPMIDRHGDPQPLQVRLGRDAWQTFESWHQDHISEGNADEFPSYLQGAWAKMPGQLLRMALILHAIEGETHVEALSESTLDAAAALICYFKAHARRNTSKLA